MSYNSTTKKITAPVSIRDVQRAIGKSNTDLGTLCMSNKINMWSKCKPINAALIRPLDYSISEQVTNYHAGLSIVVGSTESAFIAAVKAAFTNSSYFDKSGYCVMTLYDRPTGGSSSPFRLSDFSDYDHDQELDFTMPDVGDGLPISPVYSRNIEINLISPADVTLPDDSAKLTYYDNFMRSTINSRTDLHVLDLVSWAQVTQLSLAGLKRGMLIWNDDYTDIFVETVPWLTDTSLKAEYGDPEGKSINVVEFYYNNSGTGYKYLCIPQFCYVTTCKTRFVFVAYPDFTDAANNYIQAYISTFRGEITDFENLWIGMEIKLPSSSTWDRVNLAGPTGGTYDGYVTIRYNGNTVVLSSSNTVAGAYAYALDGGTGVLKVDSTWASGTKIRLFLYGSLTLTASTYERFYETDSEHIITI